MNRLTKFEVMRRNRRTLEKAAEAREVEAAWEQHRNDLQTERDERGQTTVDWLAETREAARQYKPATSDDTLPPPRRGLLRRAFNYCTGVGRGF